MSQTDPVILAWEQTVCIGLESDQRSLPARVECQRQKSLKDVRFAVNLSKNVRFALNEINAENNKLLGGKSFFHRLSGEKKFRLKSQFLPKFTAKFTANITKSCRCKSCFKNRKNTAE